MRRPYRAPRPAPPGERDEARSDRAEEDLGRRLSDARGPGHLRYRQGTDVDQVLPDSGGTISRGQRLGGQVG
jgi:hypothetical protein